MKNKIINIFLSFILLFFTVLLFYNSDIIVDYYNDIFLFAIKVIVPSIFPFMIFINLILTTNTIDYISFLLKPIGKLFNLSGYGITCLIASILGGFPYSAIIVSLFYKSNKITMIEAENLISCAFFPSLSFLFSALYSLDKNTLPCILSLYISSFLLLIYKSRKSNNLTNKSIDIIINNDYSDIYFNVMNESIKSIFSIIFSIIFFNIISAIISLYVNNDTFVYFISGILEFSNFSLNIVLLEDKQFIHYFMLNFILSFSSISIIFQSFYYLKTIGYKLKKLLLSRIAISILSSIIFVILSFCIKSLHELCHIFLPLLQNLLFPC